MKIDALLQLSLETQITPNGKPASDYELYPTEVIQLSTLARNMSLNELSAAAKLLGGQQYRNET